MLGRFLFVQLSHSETFSCVAAEASVCSGVAVSSSPAIGVARFCFSAHVPYSKVRRNVCLRYRSPDALAPSWRQQQAERFFGEAMSIMMICPQWCQKRPSVITAPLRFLSGWQPPNYATRIVKQTTRSQKLTISSPRHRAPSHPGAGDGLGPAVEWEGAHDRISPRRS